MFGGGVVVENTASSVEGREGQNLFRIRRATGFFYSRGSEHGQRCTGQAAIVGTHSKAAVVCLCRSLVLGGASNQLARVKSGGQHRVASGSSRHSRQTWAAHEPFVGAIIR